VGALTGQNLVPFSLGRDNQNGGEQTSPTAWAGGVGVGFCDAGGGILHIAELLKSADCKT